MLFQSEQANSLCPTNFSNATYQPLFPSSGEKMEARVGIGQPMRFKFLRPAQSQLLRSQARGVTGNETTCKMGMFRCFVKSPSTQSPLANQSEKIHLNGRCWHFCWHFFW
jgi:hypothetical protein